MTAREHGVRWRGGSMGLIAAAAVLLASLAALNGSGGFGPGPSESPTVPASPPAGSIDPDPGSSTPSDVPAESRAAPDQSPVVSDGVWYSEIAYQQWVAGQVGPSRTVRLPLGAVPLTGGGGVVVTGVRSATQTSVAVWHLGTGKTRTEVTVPFNVTGAAVAADGSTAYLAGVTGENTITDVGVVALAIETGSVEQVLSPASLRPEWEGSAGRGELVLSPSGKMLATTLCGAPAGSHDSTCDISVLDLTSGSVISAFGPVDSYLAAVTDDTVVTRTQFRDCHEIRLLIPGGA